MAGLGVVWAMPLLFVVAGVGSWHSLRNPFVLQGEHFETGHLWFVVLLLTFSLPLAPVAGRLSGRRVRALAATAGHPGVIFLAALPIVLVNAALGLEEGLAGWNRWAYLLLFLYGFVLATDERFRAALRRHARVAAVLGALTFGATAPGFMSDGTDPFTARTHHR
jgi:glucan biosynthesis protein C